MRLRQRLKVLESRSPIQNKGTTVIITYLVAPTPDGPGPGHPLMAYVVGTDTVFGVALKRLGDETDKTFLARAEAERLRIHG